MNGKLLAILGMVLAATAVGGCKEQTGGSGNGTTSSGSATVAVVSRPIPKASDSIVDAEYGKKLFEGSCAACHGYGGRGDGSAASYLWRRPLDLGEGAYLTTRTDEQLMNVIAEGGREHARSRLMPDWITFHNRYEQLDLLAYIRTMHPQASTWLPGATKVVRVQSVLPVALVDGFKAKLAPEAPWQPARDHTVDFVRSLDGSDKAVGHAVFAYTQLAGERLTICVAIGADGAITAAGTHQDVRAGETSLDPFFAAFKGKDEAGLLALKPAAVGGADAACAQLAAEVRKAYLRLRAAIVQDQADLELQANPPAPQSKGEEIYRQACASCHGVAGNAKGKNLKEIQPWPRNFRDGVYMNQPEITREYFLLISKKGGIPFNISSTMPAFETSIKTDEEWKALMEFVEKLPIPAKEWR